MRIPSGVTDQYIYFVAVDITDLKTRETGLTTFTVYRDRNGAGAAAMTTPTVTEVSAGNMPGVYKLLCDEDMAIGAGNDSEEMVFHITQADMAPVTRTIEIYRRPVTAGYTLGVESDGDLTKVNTLDGQTPQTGDSFARVGATGSGLTSLAQASLVTSARMGTLTDWIDGGRLDLLLDAIKAVTDNLPNSGALTTIGTDTARLTAARAQVLDDWINAGRLDAILDQILADTADLQANQGAWLTATGFSTHDAAAVLAAIQAAGTHLTLIKAVTDNLPDSGALTTIGTDTARLTAVRAAVLTDWINAGRLDLILDAIAAKTTNLPASPAAVGSEMALEDGAVTAAKIATDAITAAKIAADAIGASELAADAATEIAVAVMASLVETGYDVTKILRIIAAAVAGKLSGAATSTNTIRDILDAKDRITATVDADGNRTAITLDGT